MTKHEKISNGLSVLAIAISLLSPIASYYYLDPTTKAFKDRGRFECRLERDNSTGTQFFRMTITNIGKREAKEPQIIFGGLGDKDNTSFTISPPLDFTQELKGNKKYITIKRALAPKGEFMLIFTKPPQTIWVSNEFGETSEFSFFGGTTSFW